MAAPDLLKSYDTLRAAYALPSFSELNSEFDIDTIAPDTKHLAKEVAKKIFERTDSFRKILEAALQPESVLEMQEAEQLAENEHIRISATLRALMRIDRHLLLAELENTDAAYARFILAAAASWPALKADIRPLVEQLYNAWGTPRRGSKTLSYLG
jgi:hypothetical protein